MVRVRERKTPKSWLEMRELVIKVADKIDKERCEARKKAKKTRIVQAGEFCELFCCNNANIKEWRSQGMPYIKNEGCYIYDVEKCHAWFRGEV